MATPKKPTTTGTPFGQAQPKPVSTQTINLYGSPASIAAAAKPAPVVTPKSTPKPVVKPTTTPAPAMGAVGSPY